MYSPGLNFSLEPRFCMCLFRYPWNHWANWSQISCGTSMGKGKKVYSNGPGRGPGHLLFFIIVNGGAGAFSRDFTINLSPQCRAFSRALKTEKLQAPLFPGPVGAGQDYKWLVHYYFTWIWLLEILQFLPLIDRWIDFHLILIIWFSAS